MAAERGPQLLRPAIEHLAGLDRESCGAGEHRAAEWIAAALRDLGVDAGVEHERVHGSYWWPLGLTSAAGVLAWLEGRRGHRAAAAVLGAAGSLLAVDELGAGHRPLRSLLPKKVTANVVARAGDPLAARTVLLVSHHDAAHTSVFFDPRLTTFVGRLLSRRAGAELAEGARPGGDAPPRQPPLMAPIAFSPAAAGLASLFGARRLACAAAALCVGIVASFVEMANRRTVPGANDNLTGVATLLGVADALRRRPLEDLRVLLLSTGAEETLMEGMRAFFRRHGDELDPASTSVVCVDTVGSPRLVLAASEGMVRSRRYDEALNALIARCAAEEGIPLVRGMRMRLGTDAYVALRHGLPAAMLMSVDRFGSASNYHWPTDVPDNVDWASLDGAVRICEALLRHLAGQPGH